LCTGAEGRTTAGARFTGAALEATTVVGALPRPAMAANTSNPPPTITATAIVSSRFPNPGFRAGGAAVGDALGVAEAIAVADAVGGTAGVAAGTSGIGMDVETLGVETDVAADVSEGAALGNDNGRSGTDADEAVGTWYWAHFSQPSHTEAESEISRPHDAQRFTRCSCPHTRRTSPDSASRVPSRTVR